MGLNKDMQDLMENIKRSLIFYIPRNLFSNMQQKHLDELEHIGFLNTLFYLNAMGDSKPVNHDGEYVKLLSKDVILKSNVFQLLELKSILDKNAFHYLLDDYIKELDSNITFTDAIRKEAKSNTINYESHIQGYLDLQYNQLVAHKDEMTQKFGSWKSEFENERIVSFIKKLMPQLDQSKTAKNTLVETNYTDKAKGMIKRKHKVELPKVADVDNYLLETVFNVDLTKVNK